jgi:hypothetical protein
MEEKVVFGFVVALLFEETEQTHYHLKQANRQKSKS